MARSIKASSLKAGDVIYVKGFVDFSRVTRKIEVGTEEFNNANTLKKASGARPALKSYSTITITQPSIKTQNPDAFRYVDGEIVADTSLMTPLEVYAYESMFKSKKHNDWRLTNENKGNLPQIGEMNTETKEVTLLTPKGELAKGLEVLLVFNVFATEQGQGVGLNAILSLGPIRYYSADDTQSALNNLGFTIKDNRDPQPQPTVSETKSASVDIPASNEPNIFTEIEDDPIHAEDSADELPWG